jgi:hypothetical protein
MKLPSRKYSPWKILCLVALIGIFLAFACARPAKVPLKGNAALAESADIQRLDSPYYVNASEMIKLANRYDISLTDPDAVPLGSTVGERLMWRDWIYSEIEKKYPDFKRP